MANPTELEMDAVSFAKLAVDHDQLNKHEVAIFYYTEAAQALLSAAMAGSHHSNLIEKANEYILRGEELKRVNSSGRGQVKPGEIRTTTMHDTERAQYLLEEAFEEDEAGNEDEAVELYTQAIELLLKIRETTPDAKVKAKVANLAAQALDRAEELKKAKAKSMERPGAVGGDRRILPKPLGEDPFGERITASPRASTTSVTPRNSRTGGSGGGGGGGYTKEEIQVLASTSRINGREYVPFMDVDRRERFAFPIPFSDTYGLLALSSKQRSHLRHFVRPSDFMREEPKMIMLVSAFSIRQTIVTDCSFVASMAIAAQYERRFRTKLVTNIIYPQNRQGDPVYNPCGKYMVKLNINGVPRKVIIDDFLPMGRDGELLCSYSNNKSELWVSLLEKAYMKVMGGYDFPGSNSNIDLHALTGWIPERVAIRLGTVQFNKDKEFRKLLDRFHKGHCLVTVATGDLPEGEADRAGLVPCHAYAMLDVREINGLRLFMLKNPWNHLRWHGNYSERDTQHWTPELQRALNYDVNSARLTDNGVFWIDYDSLCKFFDVIYINWNPGLFPNTTCIHSKWAAGEGPKKDIYSVAENPQFRLEVRTPPGTSAPVWVQLTRHITDKDDFANNREFMALVVYKNVKSRKVYYPSEPPPFRDGVRINSPHYLVKMIQEQNENTEYTLMVSQYEKSNTINYTLRVYSSVPFKFYKISDPFKHEKEMKGAWRGASAGGCKNHPESYRKNPSFQINLNNSEIDNHLLLDIRAPRDYAAGFDIVCMSPTRTDAPGAFSSTSSGDFRRGYAMWERSGLSGGIYNIVPCTYRAGQEGPFLLRIRSIRPMTIQQLQ